jgi:hypothetical protein
MEAVTAAASLLGPVTTGQSASGARYVSIQVGADIWAASKGDYWILTCNSQYAVVSQDDAELVAAFQGLARGERPQKNRGAQLLSVMSPQFGRFS